MSEKRRLVVRKAEMTIKEGEYAGWSFTAITNPPIRVIEELTTSGISHMVSGLAKILVPPWNFVDTDGEPMGEPSEETIRELPVDLIMAISEAYVDQSTSLPQK